MRIRFIIIILFAFGAGQNCSAPSRNFNKTQNEMTNNLLGFWQKISNDDCGKAYPGILEFKEKGLYFAHKSENDTYTIWDVGTYSLDGDTKIKLSTANDAVISYNYAVLGDKITFEVSDSCTVTYQKQK